MKNDKFKSDNWLMGLVIIIGIVFLYISVLMHLYIAYLLLFKWKTTLAQKLFKYPGEKVDDAEPMAKIVALYSISYSILAVVASTFYFRGKGRFSLPWVVCALTPKCVVALAVFAAHPTNWINATLFLTPPFVALLCLLLTYK